MSNKKIPLDDYIELKMLELNNRKEPPRSFLSVQRMTEKMLSMCLHDRQLHTQWKTRMAWPRKSKKLLP